MLGSLEKFADQQFSNGEIIEDEEEQCEVLRNHVDVVTKIIVNSEYFKISRLRSNFKGSDEIWEIKWRMSQGDGEAFVVESDEGLETATRVMIEHVIERGYVSKLSRDIVRSQEKFGVYGQDLHTPKGMEPVEYDTIHDLGNDDDSDIDPPAFGIDLTNVSDGSVSDKTVSEDSSPEDTHTFEIIQQSEEYDDSVDFETQMYQAGADDTEQNLADVDHYNADLESETVTIYCWLPDNSIGSLEYDYSSVAEEDTQFEELLDVAYDCTEAEDGDIDLTRIELLDHAKIPVSKHKDSWVIALNEEVDIDDEAILDGQEIGPNRRSDKGLRSLQGIVNEISEDVRDVVRVVMTVGFYIFVLPSFAHKFLHGRQDQDVDIPDILYSFLLWMVTAMITVVWTTPLP